ncbi:hypothetical protein BGZ97_000378, partial [Linnemannia gamsii]
AKAMQAKSLLGANIELRIQEDISSIENFLAFNKLLSNNRRISPPTSSKQPFPSLSEQELAQFFLETSTIEEKIIGGGTFKLRERQDARFKKRDDSDHLSRLKSTVAGVDYYLSEIRNIIRSEEDIKELWPGKNVHDMKILSMDAGQACVLGGFAHLPHGLDSHGKGKEVAEGTTMEGIISNSQDAVAILNDLETLDPGSASASAPMSAHTPNSDQPGTPPRDAFYNLAVKQKAIYQPIFRFRRWLEEEKKVVPDGQEESVSDIESRLPPFRGPGASVIQYVKELEQAEQRLKAFYAGNKHQFRKHHWDMERAKQADYQAIAERLLGIIGGSLGRRVEDNKDKSPVVIGIGLGQFNSGARLSSLHSTFLTYFIKKVRSLGYVVVGLNEFYTFKKCPRCKEFVAQVTMRSFYCFGCQVYHHRDVMAAHNMTNIVLERLEKQQRPDCLQPINADGAYPWKASPDTGSSSTSRSAAASSTTSRTSGRRKRSSTVSSQDQGRQGKAARA